MKRLVIMTILAVSSPLVLAGSLAPGTYSNKMVATPGKEPQNNNNFLTTRSVTESKTGRSSVMVPKAGYTQVNNATQNPVTSSSESSNKNAYEVNNYKDALQTPNKDKQQELKEIMNRNAEVNNYGIKYR